MIAERLELFAYAVSRNERDGNNYIMMKVAHRGSGEVIAEYRMGLSEAADLSQELATAVMAEGGEGPFGMRFVK